MSQPDGNVILCNCCPRRFEDGYADLGVFEVKRGSYFG
jgi:hypothetical protein